MGVVASFKELAIGVILLIVIAGFVSVGLADANITGLAATVLTFVVPLVGVGLLFAALKGFGGK